MCIICFATFIRKTVGHTESGDRISILSADGSVYCEDPSHKTLQVLSGVIIAVVAVGLPLATGFVLLRASRQYERETAGKQSDVAQRISKELSTDEDAAAWVVRDVTIGRNYSFLMDAYDPKYLYCKCRLQRQLSDADGSQLPTPHLMCCIL